MSNKIKKIIPENQRNKRLSDLQGRIMKAISLEWDAPGGLDSCSISRLLIGMGYMHYLHDSDTLEDAGRLIQDEIDNFYEYEQEEIKRRSSEKRKGEK